MKNEYEMILAEVLSIYTSQEMRGFKSFDEFWDQVNIQNAYEEEWTEEAKAHYKPYYKSVYSILRAGG